MKRSREEGKSEISHKHACTWRCYEDRTAEKPTTKGEGTPAVAELRNTRPAIDSSDTSSVLCGRMRSDGPGQEVKEEGEEEDGKAEVMMGRAFHKRDKHENMGKEEK